MKLRFTDRLSNGLAWTLIACLSAPFAVAIIALLGLIAFGQYSSWLRGYSTLTCEVHTSGDIVSPAGRWTARIERSEGCDFGADPWLDVALIPNDRPAFLARHKWVFVRGLGGERPGSDRIAIDWRDDHTLEVRTAPCAPACRRWDEASKAYISTGVSPCETSCWAPVSVAGVVISMKPPEQ